MGNDRTYKDKLWPGAWATGMARLRSRKGKRGGQPTDEGIRAGLRHYYVGAEKDWWGTGGPGTQLSFRALSANRKFGGASHAGGWLCTYFPQGHPRGWMSEQRFWGQWDGVLESTSFHALGRQGVLHGGDGGGWGSRKSGGKKLFWRGGKPGAVGLPTTNSLLWAFLGQFGQAHSTQPMGNLGGTLPNRGSSGAKTSWILGSVGANCGKPTPQIEDGPCSLFTPRNCLGGHKVGAKGRAG